MIKHTLLLSFLLLVFGAKAQDKTIRTNLDKKPVSQVSEYPFFVGLKMGYSTMPYYFDSYPYSMPAYYNTLDEGIHIDATAHYMVSDQIGLGAVYSFFGANASGMMPSLTSSSLFSIMVSEEYRHYVNYLGPSVLFRQFVDAQRKISISESLSAGVALYRLEYQSSYPDVTQTVYSEGTNSMLLTGHPFGGKVGITATYKLLNNLSVGLGGDFLWCRMKKASLESVSSYGYTPPQHNQELAEPIKLHRIDYSFVLYYYFDSFKR